MTDKLETLRASLRAQAEEHERVIDEFDSAAAFIQTVEDKVRAALLDEYRAPDSIRELVKKAVRARETGDVSQLPTFADAQVDYAGYLPLLWT